MHRKTIHETSSLEYDLELKELQFSMSYGLVPFDLLIIVRATSNAAYKSLLNNLMNGPNRFGKKGTAFKEGDRCSRHEITRDTDWYS